MKRGEQMAAKSKKSFLNFGSNIKFSNDTNVVKLSHGANKFLKWTVLIIGILAAAWLFNLNPFYTVDQTYMAVVKTFGSVSDVSGPGLHFKVPMAQAIERYYIGIDTVNFVETAGQEHVLYQEQYPSISVLSNDGLEVVLDVSVQAVLKKDKVDMVARSFSGNDELENWRVAVIRASVRDVIALYKADALYGDKRTEVEIKIKEQIKEAVKAKDTVRLGVVRGLVANFTNELVTLKRMPTDELTDEEALNVIRRAVKQRKDSIEQFTKGRREDLVDNERSELRILETYLPAQMTKDEVMKVAKKKMAELEINPSTNSGQAKSKAGQLMGAVMKELKGKADGNTVKLVVDELFQ